MISHRYKCIFLHIPKCAGTSIEYALGHHDRYDGRGRQDHRTLRMIERPLLSPYVLSKPENCVEVMRRFRHWARCHQNPNNSVTVNARQYNQYFEFTFVRNPWARAYSWYRNAVRDETHRHALQNSVSISFAEFIQKFAAKGMLRPQTYWIKNFRSAILLDFIGRFENLQSDFDLVCKRLKIQTASLPHSIPGNGEDYRAAYDRTSRNIVSKVYQNEIEMFDCTFEV